MVGVVEVVDNDLGGACCCSGCCVGVAWSFGIGVVFCVIVFLLWWTVLSLLVTRLLDGVTGCGDDKFVWPFHCVSVVSVVTFVRRCHLYVLWRF